MGLIAWGTELATQWGWVREASREERPRTCVFCEKIGRQRAGVDDGTFVHEDDELVVFRDWRVVGEMPGAPRTEVVVAQNGRVIFGKCACAFFQQHLLNQGPCAHMVALLQVSAPQRTDGP